MYQWLTLYKNENCIQIKKVKSKNVYKIKKMCLRISLYQCFNNVYKIAKALDKLIINII